MQLLIWNVWWTQLLMANICIVYRSVAIISKVCAVHCSDYWVIKRGMCGSIFAGAISTCARGQTAVLTAAKTRRVLPSHLELKRRRFEFLQVADLWLRKKLGTWTKFFNVPSKKTEYRGRTRFIISASDSRAYEDSCILSALLWPNVGIGCHFSVTGYKYICCRKLNLVHAVIFISNPPKAFVENAIGLIRNNFSIKAHEFPKINRVL